MFATTSSPSPTIGAILLWRRSPMTHSTVGCACLTFLPRAFLTASNILPGFWGLAGGSRETLSVSAVVHQLNGARWPLIGMILSTCSAFLSTIACRRGLLDHQSILRRVTCAMLDHQSRAFR